MMPREPLPPIKFKELADALLARIGQLVPEWLPGGTQSGKEYKCGSLSGGAGNSCSVKISGNENPGSWSDFATGEKGGDLVSLYAAINDLSMGKAALLVAREEGLESVAGVQPARSGTDVPKREPRPEPPPAPVKKKPDEKWSVVAPVPDFAPPFHFKHEHYPESRVDHLAEYRIDAALYGYIVRVMRSKGGKVPLPFTWCISDRDGLMKWVGKTFVEPRPLYFPAHVSPIAFTRNGEQPLPTVILVEGEKKADILQALLDAFAPGVYLVASWPGGCNSWKKADWTWLAGCPVLLWPDCDAHRENLTKKERESCLDDDARTIMEATKPLLPVSKQPGMAAMLGIGALLRAAQGCTVQLLPIPAPLEVKPGWDCADAISTDGWDGERVLAFFGRAQPLPADSSAPKAEPGAGGGGGNGEKNRDLPAEAGDSDDAFQHHIDFICDKLGIEIHELGINRKLVIAALRKAPALKDCLGFNELTGAPSTQVAWPWRLMAGPLEDSDALRLGDWLCNTYKLKAASRAALDEAIDTVADERRFHPIRDWLTGLKHDGVPRREKWLIHVLGMDPATLAPKKRRYLELMGKYLLGGLVARVMDPGCKFDYSPVFEGLTGVGKSTLARELVGTEFFSDTHFDIGNGKDGMEQLEGLWAYELSEMTAFRKADNEQVKQFFSSMSDRFRGAYGKFVKKHPRQCVIICTTNKRVYLYDLTGNRRFWPVWIDQPIKLDWIRKYRAQLFAEAYAAYRAGERYAPTVEEEDEFFVPEQKKRLVETAVQGRLYEMLTREGAPSTEDKVSSHLNQLTTFVTLDRLVTALGTDAAKSSNLLEGQIRGWLEAQGWKYGRKSTGQRPYGYKQPKVWPPKIEDEDDENEEIEDGGVKPPVDDSDGRQAHAESHGGNDDEPF